MAPHKPLPLGIRGTLALGLAGLLATAGVIAGFLVFDIVSDEALREIAAQQRQRAQILVAYLSDRCATVEACEAALADLPPGAEHDLRHAALVGPGPTAALGGALSRADRDSVIADGLQSRALAWAFVERDGARLHRIAAPMRTPTGARGALSLTFDLSATEAALSGRQAVVIWSLIADLAGVLIFGIYLSGRHIVGPVRALTQAADLIAEAGAYPDITLPRQGPTEIARLSAAFEAMIRRLAAQQAALKGQLEALEIARSELVRSEKLATVGRLASGVAHEIGNPLAAVIGYVEFMQDPRGVPPDTQTDLLNRMRQELARIQDTVRDLLDFSRPAQGTPAPTDAAAVARSAYELVRYQRRFKAVEVIFELPSDLPAVHAVGARLRQIFVNLLLNAADALADHPGDRRVYITGQAIAQGDRPGVEISVRDTGPGVSSAQAEQLFEPFFTTKTSGTGLGLAISQRLVEEVGGRLTLVSGDQAGAIFAVWLPASA